MPDLRPIGTEISVDFPPDSGINSHCGVHWHRWLYLVDHYALTIDLTGQPVTAEVLKVMSVECLKDRRGG